jgi:hypothetical protein
MPDNNQPQLVPPQLIWLNIKNSIWMEIPRYEGVVWEGCYLALYCLCSFIVLFFC